MLGQPVPRAIPMRRFIREICVIGSLGRRRPRGKAAAQRVVSRWRNATTAPGTGKVLFRQDIVEPCVPKKTAAAFDFPTHPEPETRKVWFWRGIGMSLFHMGFIGFLLIAGLGPIAGIPLFLLVYLTFLVSHAIWCRMAVDRYFFEVLEDAIVVRKGIVFRTTTRIPMRKIQDIHVRQGPLMRRFGLASVKLDTAGGFTPARGGGVGFMAEGQLPGILNAEAVAEELLQRVKAMRHDL